MKNVKMARDYAFRAARCLKEAKSAFEEDDFPGTVRRSQEALEIAAKSILRYLGIEYPREHDVGDALPAVADKLPPNLRERVPEVQKLLTELADIRGPAFYGYEREGVPPSDAFEEDYAKDILEKVEDIVERATRFVEF